MQVMHFHAGEFDCESDDLRRGRVEHLPRRECLRPVPQAHGQRKARAAPLQRLRREREHAELPPVPGQGDPGGGTGAAGSAGVSGEGGRTDGRSDGRTSGRSTGADRRARPSYKPNKSFSAFPSFLPNSSSRSMNGAVCSRQVRVGSVPGAEPLALLDHGHHSFARSPLKASIVRLTIPRARVQSDGLALAPAVEVERRPGRRGEAAAGGGGRDRAGRVVPEPDGGDHGRRVADEPDVGAVVGRPGLAGDGLADAAIAHQPAGAAVDHRLEHRGELKRLRRAEHAFGRAEWARARARCRRPPRSGARATASTRRPPLANGA